MLYVCFVIELKAWKFFLNRISLQFKWNFLCMTSCQRIKIEINLLLSRLSSVCGQNMTFGDCLLLFYAEFITTLLCIERQIHYIQVHWNSCSIWRIQYNSKTNWKVFCACFLTVAFYTFLPQAVELRRKKAASTWTLTKKCEV